MKQTQWKLPSPIGPLYLVASEKALHGVFWEEQAVEMASSLRSAAPAVRILRDAATQLGEYFAGRRTRFELPLDAQGTDFQKRVWKQLGRIPYGKTHSYRDIARKLRSEKAVRAVGTANGRNPLCIIVPCHRVIASSGKLGGYSGGLAAKHRLLELERAALTG